MINYNSKTRYTVFIKNLTLEAIIGLQWCERYTKQRIIINMWVDMIDSPVFNEDDCSKILCYANIVKKIQTIVAKSRVKLLETMAEQIVERCLKDERIARIRIRIEKPDIIQDCASVGIEIERSQMMDG